MIPPSNPLGVGVVWWPALDPLCRESEGLVSVLEAEPEAFWIPEFAANGRRRFRSHLDQALGAMPQPRLLHGVGAPLGDTCAPLSAHTETFLRELELIRPQWLSEHLSFSRFTATIGVAATTPVFSGFLLPPAQSPASAAVAAANIRHRRDAYGGAPLAFETGVSYLPPLRGEMPDGEYAAAVATAADCGILLDLHNLLCNQRNGRQAVADFCAALPLDRVWEVHLAGGQDQDGFRLDAHSGLVEPELLELAAAIVPALPNLCAIIFEVMPDFVPIVGLSAIAHQLETLNDLWAGRRDLTSLPVPRTAGEPRPGEIAADGDDLDPLEWEMLIGARVTDLPEPMPREAMRQWWRAAEPALDLYRRLTHEGRAGMLVAIAPCSIRLLLRRLGSKDMRRLLAQFWLESRAAYTAIEEGRNFLGFLSRVELNVADLAEAIAADHERIDTILKAASA